MFWNMMSQFENQQIENLLDKEGVTLSEVLDEDNIVQEVVHRNKKLISYLCRADTLKEMVELVSLDSAYKEVDLEETDEYENIQRRFKRANQVSELLNADNEEVGKTLVESTELLDILMSILKNEETLNPLLASFFSKIFGGLLKHHPEQTWNYLKNKEDLMDDIIKHMQTLGILDFILRMVTCPSENEQVRSEIIDWMVDEELVEKLIDLLNNEQRMNSDVHTYACCALSDLVKILREGSNGEGAARCPLLNRLTQTSTIEKVLAQMVISPIDSSVFAAAATVLSTFLEPVQKLNLYPWEGESLNDQVSYYPSAASTVDVLANHVPRLHSILQNPPDQEPLRLPFGILDPPLGKVRLNIVKLISESIPQKLKSFFTALKETDIINTIIQLFFKYDNNSFLSGYFTTIVTEILKGDFDDELIIRHLFDECELIEKLSEAWFKCREEEKQGLPRKGFMGHIYKILQLIVDYHKLDLDESEDSRPSNEMIRHKLIKEHVSKISDDTLWTNICEELNQVTEIQGRSLGKKKLANCSITHESQPSSAAEDALARYQQKISPDFQCDFGGVDDDTEGDFPSLQNDEILDKDEALDSIGRKSKEDLFNELCAEHENDWITEMEEEGTRTSEEPTSEQPTAVEASKESKDDKNEEKMDTSGSPQSPWGEPAGDPVLAWSNSSTSSSNAKTDNQTSGDGWANFDDADFGQPDRSSSPESAKNSEKMETDTFSTPANNSEGNGDTSKPSNPAE